jgi:Prokaryotic membrane lipoprotein lipid attachment site
MKKTLFGLCAVIVLTGCRDQTDRQTIAINQASANNPEFVADTKKGKLYRIEIDMGFGRINDRVYYFENSNETTVNQSKGKQTEAIVIVDGKQYIVK